MVNVPEMFGCMVFGDEVMRERLPKDTYKKLKQTMENGQYLDPTVADVVATAMKDWAVEKGATHYTHWFQPMTGMTAEKHDSFISPTREGKVTMEFSGKELIKGEPDASSFPSGGLRATFEARGYTAWDPSSYAFIKDDTLCIPTAFCSYGGAALDQKTPLLRSMAAINRQAMRILRLFGTPATRANTTVGPEQEYFLIDKEVYDRRKDLKYCGRTLFGARPPKGQELDDHYFGSIKARVKAYMRELDEELWKLGIYAKTEHNEVAPGQHELAPIFTTTNIAADHNQLTMETMKKVAANHGLVCLLHEKPFAGVNGSGKHNNWSLSTDTGINLLEPGTSPKDNAQFLTFLCAVIRAVDEHQDLLRISVASAGNDHRLGASEAPPAIISIFLGDELYGILRSIEKDREYDEKSAEVLDVGVDILPHFPKDTTDRNRTSPFAFTGNKFEFRMVGSMMSISDANVVLNTAVADVLSDFADTLEAAVAAGGDFLTALNALLKETIKAHKRIVFNGNNYSDEWVKEAERRGLLNLRKTTDALKLLDSEKNIALFEKFGVLSETEIKARLGIHYENYRKVTKIEGYTMLDMVYREILPATLKYTRSLSDTVLSKRAVSAALDCSAEESIIEKLSPLSAALVKEAEILRVELQKTKDFSEIAMKAEYYSSHVVPAMERLRAVVDEIEPLMAEEFLPYPTYGKLLFSVI